MIDYIKSILNKSKYKVNLRVILYRSKYLQGHRVHKIQDSIVTMY